MALHGDPTSHRPGSLVGPDAAYRRATGWLGTLRRLTASTERFATLRAVRELHLGPVPRRDERLDTERREALETLDAVESGIRLTSSHDWLDRVVAEASSICGVRIPLHCPACMTPLRIRGAGGALRVRCRRWRCRYSRDYSAAVSP